MPFRLMSSRLIVPTLEQCIKHRDMTAISGDKTLREGEVEKIVADLAKGEFSVAPWVSAKCLETSQALRVNGKHTSTGFAVFKAENPDAELPEVVYQVYECDTLDDVITLYRTFDRFKSAKKNADVQAEYKAASSSMCGINNKVYKDASAGVAFIEWGESYTGKDPKVKHQLVEANRDFAEWLEWFRETPNHRMLDRVGVVAAMFQTWKADPVKASEFWALVRDNSGANPKGGDRKVRDFLAKTVTGGRKGDSKEHGTTREFAHKCLKGWNAWRKGEVNASLRFDPGSDLPKAI